LFRDPPTKGWSRRVHDFCPRTFFGSPPSFNGLSDSTIQSAYVSFLLLFLFSLFSLISFQAVVSGYILMFREGIQVPASRYESNSVNKV
jgi:hypothetical protein